MKHLKLFFALFAMLALNVGNAWGADCDYSDDFSTVNVNTSYSTRTTTAGWNATYTAVENYTYNSKSYRAFKMNGKKGGLGKITSPLFSDGCSAISFVYGQAHKDAIKFDVKIYDKNNVELFSKSYSASKPTAAPTAGVLVEETITGVEGDFYVVFANTSTSTSTSNGYRVSIMNVCITSAGGGTEEPVLSTIEISGDLTKKTYEEGEELDFSGLTVQANYENGDPKDVTNDVEWSYTPNPLTKGTTSVEVTATYEDKTATQTINGLTVNEHIVTPGEYCITPNNTFWGTNYTGTDAAAATTLSGKQNDITILHAKNTSSSLYVNDTQTRAYAGHTMKISVPSGYVITSIAFTKGSSWEGTLSADCGTINNTNWTGTNQNVTITFNDGKCFITKICVTYIKDVKYALTITDPTAGTGTLVVKDGENVLTSGAEIYEGTKLTVTATPETGYEEGVVVVKNASDDDITATVYADGVLTMPAYAVTISATFAKKPCELLAKPTVSATTTYNSAKFTWEAVANAAKYSVKVGTTDAVETTETSYEVTDLNAKTEYTYQVQAIAEAGQDTYCDSEVAEGTFTTATAPTATLTLKDIVGTKTLTGSLNGTITLPTEAAECSKTFVGWDAEENCDHAPTYAKGAEYTLAALTQTLYAVYADGEGGGNFTITKTMSEIVSDNGYTVSSGSTATCYTSLTLDENITLSTTGSANCGSFWSNPQDWRLYQNKSGNAIVTATNGCSLTSVKFTFTYSNAGTLLNNGVAMTSGTAVSASGTSATYTVGNSGSATNGQIRITAIEVSYSKEGEYSNYSTTCAAAPIATVDPTSVTATAAGVNGTLEVSYENVNTEDLRVALFNDEECGVVFNAGWLTASIDADKNITYTVEENTTYAERKAYIQLTAPDAAAATDPAVVVIPVTQAAKEKVFASLAELVAADLTAGDEVTVTLNNDVIKDFYIYSSKRCGVVFDVQKDGKDIKIYFNSQTTIDNWAVGGKLSGTLTNVKWTTYSSAWQLAPANTWAWANLTYTEPKAVSTVVVSGAPTKTTYVDGETFDPAGLTVTVNYNDATTEVNPAGVTFEVTPTTLTKGETAVSVTATFNSVTSEAYTVNNLIVTDIQSMTILDFITSGGTRCYLEGIVSGLTEGNSIKYGNFDLTDASGTIYVYGCLNASGEKEKFAELGVKNGDKIKVIADELTVYNNKDQAKDVQYVSHKSAATIEVSNITMEVGETQTIAATITPAAAETAVVYTIKENTTNAISLSDNTITALTAGTATIVVTIAETADYLGATKEFTVTVTTVDTRKKAVSPSPFTATSGELNPNDITYASYQGGASTAPGIYNNGIRLYQISNGKTYGGFITLTAVKGCMIDQVEIKTTDKYSTTVAYSVDDNVTLLGSASVAKSSTHSTPAGLNTESVNILNLGTTNENRLEIASITVYYTGQPLADPELSWTSNAEELRVGEAFTAPTLNNPYNITGITYSSDNESLATVDASTGVVSLVPDATGTATITATFGGNDTYKAAVVSYTITVKPALVYGVWELVTDVASLTAGDKVVIVAKDYDFALSTTQGNNNRGQAAVTKNSDNTVAFGNDVQVLTLETGAVENTFALNTGKGYLYAASSSSNYLRTETTLSNNSSWAIAVSADGTVTIVAKGSNTRNTMQYNQTSSVFACYASASQKALCLYMKKNVKVEGETDNTSIPNQSDVTVDNAELTVTTEAEYDNMYIGNNGSVDVEETVTVNNLYIQTTMGTTTSGQLNTAPENLIVNGDAFIDITLGKNGDPSQWHAFTVPFPVDAMNGIFDLNDNKLTNGVNYAIMQYHGDVRAQGKYGWKKYSGVLVPGTFYLMTVDGARTTYRFKKVKDAELVAEKTKSLSAYTGGGKTTDHGWNGVGNPTLMHGTVAFAAQILDPQSYTYVTVPASSAHFTVGTPFFIQAATDGTMTMDAEPSASLAPARRAAAAVDKVKVMLGNADYTDYLYVSASEDATNDYEIGKDLVKMVMTNTPIVPQIFAEAYGARLCMVNAPMTSNEATIALNLYAPADGEYTISTEAQEGNIVYLLYNGNIVWNLSMSEYPIQLSQGDNAGYSLVVRRENAPTDVENILGADEQTEKFIYNGKLYILHEGKVFDAVGNVLK